MNRKAVIFLADGMADEPLEELGGKTPLEAVDTPAMDSIAKRGVSGTFLTLPEGLPTSSDVANMSVLGYYPEKNYPGRGPIEAVSQGIRLADDDVAFRCNLVYVSPDGVLRDYSAGHVDNETAAKLMAALQEKFGNDDVTFHSGVSYRNLLVLHGRKFSDKVNYFKPDSSQDIPLAELPLTPADDSPEAAYTVEFLNRLCALAAAFLASHELNAGKASPANCIWPWSPGRRPNLPKFSEVYEGRRGAIISAVDVIKGIGKCSDMTVIEVPGATGFIDTNYAGKVSAALAALKDHDLVYLHVEAIDECSHLGDLKLKMQAISDFDSKIVAPVLKALEGKPVNFAVLPDHPVPIKLRKHTRTPVPVAICGPEIEPDAVEKFSETLAPTGKLGFLKGNQLVRKLLEL
ncbi:cofactor-independent phosphoglycerate mutase [uncultured Victivallis sp.]|uniref:cofactor-independent phosphoglycerate mutase n=1 Tax=uncultured Victivallis sp. TaxID=354118 RepID=UPI0025D822A4|nr:cofactor-independent phosphoglycerate mutase [uncultured Victivallis sp.]